MKLQRTYSMLLLLSLTVIPALAGTTVYTFTFDENGNGSYLTNGANPQTLNGSLQPDTTSAIGVNVLTWALPFGLTSIPPGDLFVQENGSVVTSDLVRLANSASTLIFYSLTGGGMLADTGLPPNAGIVPGAVFYGTVSESPAGLFTFTAPGGQLIMNGTSPELVPEPATLSLLAFAVLPLAIAIRKRTRKA